MSKVISKIIKDGVDVTGCGYFCEIDKECNICGMGTDGEDTFCRGCKDNPDCYYKQLKRLQHYQAEFEHELMNDYTYDGYISPNGFTPIDVIKHIKSELKRLEQENEQLKKSIDRIMQNKEIKTIDLDIAKENAELKAECERLKEELRTEKKALQEIKDIVSEPCIVDENCQTCNSSCMQKDILIKINEVIGVE